MFRLTLNSAFRAILAILLIGPGGAAYAYTTCPTGGFGPVTFNAPTGTVDLDCQALQGDQNDEAADIESLYGVNGVNELTKLEDGNVVGPNPWSLEMTGQGTPSGTWTITDPELLPDLGLWIVIKDGNIRHKGDQDDPFPDGNYYWAAFELDLGEFYADPSGITSALTGTWEITADHAISHLTLYAADSTSTPGTTPGTTPEEAPEPSTVLLLGLGLLGLTVRSRRTRGQAKQRAA